MEVIINASSLDDIDPSAIGLRLTNGTASVASPVLSRLKTREDENVDVVRKNGEEEKVEEEEERGCSSQANRMLTACILTPPLPVQGTVYEKTNAEMEMKKINREEFWEQAKVGAELVVQSD